MTTFAVYALRYFSIISGTVADWGQFGDFVGGVMNPLIAFGAFYWLSTSVKLQKAELSETRDALVASQEAQQDQPETALLAAQIQTYNVRLQSTATRLNQVRTQMGELLHFQGQNGPSRTYYDEHGDPSSPAQVLEKYRGYATGLTIEENRLIADVEDLSKDFFERQAKKKIAVDQKRINAARTR